MTTGRKDSESVARSEKKKVIKDIIGTTGEI